MGMGLRPRLRLRLSVAWPPSLEPSFVCLSFFPPRPSSQRHPDSFARPPRARSSSLREQIKVLLNSAQKAPLSTARCQHIKTRCASQPHFVPGITSRPWLVPATWRISPLPSHIIIGSSPIVGHPCIVSCLTSGSNTVICHRPPLPRAIDLVLLSGAIQTTQVNHSGGSAGRHRSGTGEPSELSLALTGGRFAAL